MKQVTTAAGVRCECEYIRTINYAMQQNYVPVIRRLRLTNNGSEDLHGVTAVITAEPAFAREWRKTADTLPAGQTVDLGVVDLKLEGAFLAELTERLAGSLTVTVYCDEEVIERQDLPVDVLAFDEWGGLTVLPELIGAFVTPNHPETSRLVRSAADIVARWDRNPSFDAYQSHDPNRVRMQAAAIYAALQQESVTYCVAPASFEEIGQRIRLPDALFAQRMGNCLDLTLVYAACLEAVGLHPLIVFTKGHAFVGVWLIRETFAECVQDDVSLLTKRLAEGIHEICLIETTAVADGKSIDFEQAARLAQESFRNEDDFFGFVDLKRARASSIRPLPLRVRTASGWELREDEPAREGKNPGAAPDTLEVLERPQEVDHIPEPKQKEWERRLLDLSLRNALLNFRLSRSSIPIMTEQLGALEDALAEGGEFQLLPAPGDWKDTPRDAELYRRVSNDHPFAPLLRQEFDQKRLRADMSEGELYNRVVHLYRASRLALEENGANTLYLALGLLRWYESGASQKPRYAPIVLIPIELVRKSSRSGFLIRARDEEPQMNITLLEMLRQDFGTHIDGLDPLPKDENGVDLKRVFTTIRHAVMHHARWDVEEACCIGLFSFSQFVMWNDLRTRSAELARNKVVASLLAGKLTWTEENTFPEPDSLDRLFHPKELFVPISADSSQLAAVSAAGKGGSFVLHGPPGTGKSQTITNMIANALANGKTVLFVAEKMAALTVVQKRLESIGLGPFCLELHSNKSKKKAVLEQLRLSLEAGQTAPPEEWRRQADRLAEARQSLNAFVESLHRKRETGVSLYEALTFYDRVKEAPEVAAFDPGAAGKLRPDELIACADTMKELQAAGAACGHPHGNVWEDAAVSHYSPALKTQLEQLLAAYVRQLKACETAFDEAARLMPLPPDMTRRGLELYEQLCGLLLSMPEKPSMLLRDNELDDAVAKLKAVSGRGLKRDGLRSRLLGVFTPSILTFDASAALTEWQWSELQWFVPRWLGQRRVLKLLGSMALPGNAGRTIAKETVPELLADAIKLREESEAVKASAGWTETRLGAKLWNEGETDWQAVQELRAWTERMQQLLIAYHDGDAARALESRIAFSALLEAGREAFLERNRGVLQAYADAKKLLNETERSIFELLEADEAKLSSTGDASWFSYMADKASKWQGGLESFRDWCLWRRTRGKAAGLGLAPIAEAYERGQVTNEELVPSYERALYKAIAESVIAADESLAGFSGKLFEQQIAKFQELSERFESFTRQEIAARLSARRPQPAASAAQSSELGILQRAIRSGGRGLSIRKLFEQIPNLLSRLSPCMLMSPISVAQYLDPANPPFDLVVFDEASQMPTCEAVGAMARGRECIVVGDPKQLPPTSFFTANQQTESGDDGLSQEDMESVLDDCLALAMPQGHLLWHYRSRHESLIAFSNMQYYENKLLTFPSPRERTSNVRLIPVEGAYDRGRTKQNRAEAEAVVQEIERRLRDPQLAERSIGVVTFSSVQQTLIEDMLDELFRKAPELESASAGSPEPIFVKNLENVQGDERDVILFSIGYGPDASGKVSLNFGPLNRDGGWRRLNVAVSRARHEMLVFSTLRPEHLDISRTSAQGVAGLKAFLEYAERGAQAAGLRAPYAGKVTVGLEKSIAASIAELGYDVQTNVGCSGCRIDAAVVDPRDPGVYVLGIVTDGNGYENASTARDRDLLRTSVLEGLGWSIHNVWSLDWFENPAKETRRIEDAIRKAMDDSKLSGPTVAEGLKVEMVIRDTTDEAARTSALEPAPEAPKYEICRLERVEEPSEQFYGRDQNRLIADQIVRTVEQEGPISRSLLCRRVLQAWGITRMGSRIERRFDELFAVLQLKTTEHDGCVFFWPASQPPETYERFRQGADDESRRSAEDLPPEEIAAAAKRVLSVQISLPKDDLVREIVKRLGYQRSGAALDKAVRAGIELAAARGLAVIDEQDRVIDNG
ncbi:DUF3320 domain-containing protein [Paenibacillus thermotolerans]|uniref:DUF3320 domain-containing protein n=1 Tax=Paenibacillus thermotolerans TaxID=3027807 RepID=UPI00236881A2|nr:MULTISPECIES: DUF3320 domain-containing protein [unclassified Paenibacillus]